MCASTLCPLSSSTRKKALGSDSTTVPSISVAPSLLGIYSALHCWVVVVCWLVPAAPAVSCAGLRAAACSLAPLPLSSPIAPQHLYNSHGWLPIPDHARARAPEMAARLTLIPAPGSQPGQMTALRAGAEFT